MQPDLSIIIPAYNRLAELDACLRGLTVRLDGINSEIIVVDDASTVAGPDELSALHCVNCYRLSTRHGSAYCKNIGITESRGNYLLFLDTDIEFLDSSSIVTMLGLMEQYDDLGEIGGEALVDESGDVHYMFGRNIDFDTGGSRCDYTPVTDTRNMIDYHYIPTSHCMVRRQHAVAVNGFDDAYSCLGEDKDFGYRIKQLGLRNCVCRNSVVLHKFSPHGRRGPALCKQYRTQIRFSLRHFGIQSLPRMLCVQERRILSGLRPGSVTAKACDPLIQASEDHYVSSVLRLGGPAGLSRRDVLHSASAFVSACGWNLVHRRGLHSYGSIKMTLTHL